MKGLLWQLDIQPQGSPESPFGYSSIEYSCVRYPYRLRVPRALRKMDSVPLVQSTDNRVSTRYLGRYLCYPII